MENIQLKSIGYINTNETESFIQLDKNYTAGLISLDTFSHIFILWYFNQSAPEQNKLIEESPYKNGTQTIGTLETRSKTDLN